MVAGIAFDGHPPAAAPAFIGAVIAQQGVGIVGQTEVITVIHPLLLHELELAAQIGIHDQHDHAVIAFVSLSGRLPRPVRQTSPKNPAPVAERARYVEGAVLSKLESAAWIVAARVRAERASGPVHIVAVIKRHQLQAQLCKSRLLLRRGGFGPHLRL